MTQSCRQVAMPPFPLAHEDRCGNLADNQDNCVETGRHDTGHWKSGELRSRRERRDLGALVVSRISTIPIGFEGGIRLPLSIGATARAL